MASFEEAIAGLLTTRESITRHVADRVYDTVLPDFRDPTGRLPAVTFQVVNRDDRPHFTGYAPEYPVDVQVDVWATTAAERRAVAAVTRTAIQEWSGPWGGLTVRRAFKVSDFDGMEPRDDGAPAPTFRNTQRWTVWVRQAPVA